MGLAPWRVPLARALHRNRALVYSRYAQLATVDAQGRPHNRTLVFRGFCRDTDTLAFVTDRRSEKVQQIDHQPWGELCWYFPQTREQFRLAGVLELVDSHHRDPLAQAERRERWQTLSTASRQQFLWPHPGQPRTGDWRVEDAVPAEPPAHFCVLWLHPQQVDHLELRGQPQNRYRYWRTPSGEWAMVEVNP
ncbi:MAG: pyridoxamine 5'-phosphate oxidase family protein [Gloeomargarita sp. SKYBB_i_bin120]|nr:pyridoxamine 5'-phosphate oxidase family protein [Gloeomargarita sp. SKYG98]MCS7291716.1 pyridoxamine 5'-phosphate oxidase family protein [Gloeomargarita sp. SKYB120]MDW8177275.1 pyridoxamine 5'-phosphate oxidase family protein [Gloeomargarita sp. SKYBB_i_bin120]